MRNALVLACMLAVSTAAQAQTSTMLDSLARLNRAIESNPRSTDLRLKKAALNIEFGQWDYAAEEYGRVLAIDPNSLAALYYRAYANVKRRQYGQARADYEALLSRSPRHYEARLGLAEVYRRLKRSHEAYDALNLLIEQHPDSATAYAARAVYETEDGQHDAALYDWDEAISRQPTNADFVVSKADLLLSLGMKREARQTLNEAAGRGILRARLRQWFDRCK